MLSQAHDLLFSFSISIICFSDEESNSLPQKEQPQKEKRKLGILELATKEFEDESEVGLLYITLHYFP